jgi:hypothetical protein
MLSENEGFPPRRIDVRTSAIKKFVISGLPGFVVCGPFSVVNFGLVVIF